MNDSPLNIRDYPKKYRKKNYKTYNPETAKNQGLADLKKLRVEMN